MIKIKTFLCRKKIKEWNMRIQYVNINTIQFNELSGKLISFNSRYMCRQLQMIFF